MKRALQYLLFLFYLGLGNAYVYAQLDTPQKSISIGAKEDNEVEKKSFFSLERSSDVITAGGISIKKKAKIKGLEPESKKREVYFMQGEQFANRTYEKLENKLNNNYAKKKDTELQNGYEGDQYLGDFRSGSKFVRFVYRDHEYVDGDRVRIWLNDEVVHPNIFLTGEFKGFYVDLVEGFNRIDIEALNQGTSGPNTAQFIIYDDKRAVVSSNRWLLNTGAKATVIIVKDKEVPIANGGK